MKPKHLGGAAKRKKETARETKYITNQ